MSDPQREYVEALAGFKAAQTRLQEAKKHVPPNKRDVYRMQKRAEREQELEKERQRIEKNREASERKIQELGPPPQKWSDEYFLDYVRAALWPTL